MIDWDRFSQLGPLRAVLDQKDAGDAKNRLIDALHWNALRPELTGRERLLDFGCGTGRFAKRIQRLGIHYTGIDSSAGMIQKAREHNEQALFIYFDGIRIPFGDREFDTCLLCGVFQYIIHQAYYHTVVKELSRTLKPCGKLLLLEQASLCGKMSGTVERPSSEQDYVDALSPWFDVKEIRRIRSCLLPQLSYISFRIAKRLPTIFPFFLNQLAKREVKAYQRQDKQYYKSVDYYDILLIGERK